MKRSKLDELHLSFSTQRLAYWLKIFRPMSYLLVTTPHVLGMYVGYMTPSRLGAYSILTPSFLFSAWAGGSLRALDRGILGRRQPDHLAGVHCIAWLSVWYHFPRPDFCLDAC